MSELSAIASVTEKPILVAQNEATSGKSNLLAPNAAAPAEDVTRFENLLSTGKAESLTASPETVPPVAVERSGGMGDVILDGINKMSTAYQERVDAVNTTIETTGANGMSSGDIMQLQFELTQMTLMQDLTAKVADKTSQGVQTLFKNQ